MSIFEPKLYTIEVTEDIAVKIRMMSDAGVFALTTGNASLNFHEGVLKSIKTETMTYAKTVDNAVDVLNEISVKIHA